MENSFEKKESLGSSKLLGRFTSSLKISSETSMSKYKTVDSLWFLDSGTRLERIKYFLIGLKVFINHGKTFGDFKKFHLKRKNNIKIIKISTIISLFIICYLWISSGLFSQFAVPTGLGFLAIFLLTFNYIFSSMTENIKVIEPFFDYIDEKSKRKTYIKFLKMSEYDQEILKEFEDFFSNSINLEDNKEKYNGKHTELLLAIDFFIGEFGSVSDFRDKVTGNRNPRMNRTGFDKFISLLINAHPSTVNRFFNDGIVDRVRTKKLTSTDLGNFKTVKEIFSDSGLHELVEEVEEFITKHQF